MTVVVHSAFIVVPGAHAEHDLHDASECDAESCHVVPAVQGRHVRSAVVVHASFFVPLPQVVEQVVQEVAVLDNSLYVDPATQLTQVCCPVAGAADNRYPALQALQSSAELVPHNVPADPVARVGVPLGQVQVLAAHVNVLKVPLVLQVAVPLPLYPELHVTVTVAPVVPVRKNGKNRIEIELYER